MIHVKRFPALWCNVLHTPNSIWSINKYVYSLHHKFKRRFFANCLLQPLRLYKICQTQNRFIFVRFVKTGKTLFSVEYSMLVYNPKEVNSRSKFGECLLPFCLECFLFMSWMHEKSQSTGLCRDLNPGSPKYEAGVLTTGRYVQWNTINERVWKGREWIYKNTGHLIVNR
jgi:hypothetical protein